jgi:polar amino acid transport system substrate-binding protein
MHSLSTNLRRGLWAGATVLLATISATWVVASAQQRQLQLVSTVWPPFTNEAGQARFALDLVEAAAERIGIVTRTAMVDAAKFTPALLTGPFDGSAAAWRDAERERVLVFSQPYLENRLILVARRGGDVSAKALGELKGKRIAIVEGYAYGDDFEAAGPAFVRSQSEEDSLQLLLKSSVDYTLMDELVVQYILENHADEARSRLQLGSTPLLTRPLYLALRRDLPDAQSIISRFNAQLRAMIADRTYHRLLHVSWIRADIDGDGLSEYVPQSDRSGPAAPQRAYTLFSETQPITSTVKDTQRFYFGGNIYSSWASVPDNFKVVDSNRPDSRRSTASIFTFSWK